MRYRYSSRGRGRETETVKGHTQMLSVTGQKSSVNLSEAMMQKKPREGTMIAAALFFIRSSACPPNEESDFSVRTCG